MDLLLRIDPAAPEPLYAQLYAGLRAQILDGRLPPGARLPSSRGLARTLGLARNTVHGAYDQLIAEGYLETRHGSGTYVAASLPDDALRAVRAAPDGAARGALEAPPGRASGRPRLGPEDGHAPRRGPSAPDDADRLEAPGGRAARMGEAGDGQAASPDGTAAPAGLPSRRGGGLDDAAARPDGASPDAGPLSAAEAAARAGGIPLSAWGRRVGRVPPTPYVGPGAALPFDFRHGRPDAGHFPLDAWRRVSLHQLRTLERDDLWYGPAAGQPRLRAAIASYLGRARGVRCSVEQVIVTTGTQQALDLVTRLIVEPDDRVAVEDPCYSGARRVLLAAGARVLAQPVDEHGLDVARLPEPSPSEPPVKLVYTTPSHQYPTGATLPVSRRLELLAWAARHGALVIEDDYDSEFRHVGRPHEAMQGLDGAGRVVYLGSFSKVLYPALRLGYLVVPAALVAVASEAKRLLDLQTATPPQEALADFIEAGQFEAHLRRMRRVYRARRAALLDALARELPDAELGPSDAGLYVLVRLAPGIEEAAVARRAAALGVAVYPAAPYYARPVERAGLVLGYAALDEAQIEEGVRRLARAVRG